MVESAASSAKIGSCDARTYRPTRRAAILRSSGHIQLSLDSNRLRAGLIGLLAHFDYRLEISHSQWHPGRTG
jgi:hypothetical protein